MILAQGAEAIISDIDGNIHKDRIKKDYRISEIDEKLRRSRTRREAKVLKDLEKIGFPAPKLIEKKDTLIIMEKIDGKKLRDVLETRHFPEIAKKIAILHNNNMIHGDLTTSNMIVGEEIFFIDFGLSFHSTKIEDKAVDLHLLKQALDSKHHEIADFDIILKEYSRYADKQVVKRFTEVEKRGRNKMKI